MLHGIFSILTKQAKNNLRRRVEVFITDDKGRIFASKDKKTGGFQLPGGGIDDGETINQAANRESKEEVGLSIKNIKGVNIPPKNILWGKALAKWMNDKGRKHDGNKTYYRTAKIDKVDKSVLGVDGDEMDGEFFTKKEMLNGLKSSLSSKDKFKPFRESDVEVLSKIRRADLLQDKLRKRLGK